MGQVLATSGGTAALGYQGDLTDATTAQVDMGARWYEPALGRFTARDTVLGDPGAPVSLNQFAYAADAPIRYIDPTGMGWCDPRYTDCSNGMNPKKEHHFAEDKDAQHFYKPYVPPTPPIAPPTGAPASAWAVYKNARAEWSATQGHACLSAAECEADTTANESLADSTVAQQSSASTAGDPGGGCHGVLGCLARDLYHADQTLLHAGLDALAVAPYLVYYASYEAGRGINSLGRRFGTPGRIASHVLAFPLAQFEAVGLGADAAIDWVKGRTVNNESIRDEGRVGYINPLHQWAPGPLKGPETYLPGIHANGDIDFEW